MHVLFVERHGLEETEVPTDLDQTGADLVVLSFSDSDLGAFAEGWKRGNNLQGDDFPTLRLANLSALKHPVSVDTYIEKTLSPGKGYPHSTYWWRSLLVVWTSRSLKTG